MVDALVDGLSNAWSTLLTFIPKLLGFLVILLIGWFIAKAVSKVVGLVLSKVGFAGLMERAGLQSFMSRVNIDVSGLIVKIVYYFILLIALQFAFTAFGPNPVEQLLTQIISYLPQVIVAIILVVVAAMIARVVKNLLVSALSGRAFAPFVGNVGYVVVLALGIIAAVNQMGIATAITTPVLIFVLGTAGGILIVGVGGGLIRPMQQRWERGLTSLDRQLNEPATGGNSDPAPDGSGERQSSSPFGDTPPPTMQG